ncbi:lysine--tRNA ligase [Georgenia yuyongxinii]|uniref:Lysine--tRNA ligase n=1 Tax=Georgenia yuyongxinii TaxID=2589797 RepID=A0A5B8C5J9_9MICO|nr:lysine--tRNA ligase [Georgenia yuyongxinii]QDC25999.1 lysine--tRNA ligase [Georgenia yuyongxinii]
MTEQTTEQPGGPAAGAHEETDHLPEQVRVRSEKRQRLLDAGIDPYPVVLPVTTTIAAVRAAHDGLEAGEETDVQVGVAGRVMYLRNTGKLCFVTLQDGEGNRLQAMLSKAAVGDEALAAFKTDVDLGDHLFVHGHIGKSRRGELSIFADSSRLAAKALRPLPKTYENEAGEEVALSEEGRVRRRHLDLIMRQGARDMVRTRAAVVKSLRQALDERDFLEIETPMLQVQPGGAAARPFVTHMNAYDVDLYMRIAPELFLKRAVVGGVERVFEINRNFRNEGADSTHSPEFSMLEAYEAYGSYDTMAALTRDLIQRAALDAFGSTTVTLDDGTEYELGGEWTNLSLFDSLSEALGEEISPETPESVLTAHAERLDVDLAPHFTHGKTAEVLWEHLVGDHLFAPTFVRDFPVDTSPLTRAHRSKPGVVEKWDLYVRGFELATAYSELVDPVVQRERFATQALAAAAGDAEAMVLDEDFLEAMEQGMPPAGGMGMGIDRLLMALTGHGIRETITFPLVKRR